MSSRAFSFLVLFLLFFVENALHYLFPDQMFPLMLIAVVFFALKENMFFGALLGFWGGLWLEIFRTGAFGFAALSLAAIGAFAGFMSSKIFRESFLAQAVIPVASFYFFEVINLQLVWADFFPFKLLLILLLSPLVFYGLRKVTGQSPARRTPNWLL